MSRKYDAYACFDVSSLRGDPVADCDDPLDAALAGLDPTSAGKLLLVVSGAGVELLHVPAVLH